MNKIRIPNVDILRATVVPSLQKVLGQNLRGVWTHGDRLHAATGPAMPPWLISLWVHEDTISMLQPMAMLLQPWSKNHIELGMVLTDSSIISTRDVFPLENLLMSKQHALLDGNMPLLEYQPDRKALRLQIERELRGLLLHLRREFLLRSGSKGALSELFPLTMTRFLPLFEAAYWLVHGEFPQSPEQALAYIEIQCDLHALLTAILLEQKAKELPGLLALGQRYVYGIEKTVAWIDGLVL